MGLISTNFPQMMLGLFPRGLAWPRDPDSFLFKLAQALGDEAERVTSRALNLLEERDPKTTVELLDEWESAVGLPDQCSAGALTFGERRDAVINRLTLQGSLSKAFYVQIAATLGYKVTIQEFRQFRAGAARAGNPVSNGNWIYTWRVKGPADIAKRFRAGQGAAGDHLRYVSNKLLECTISKLKPAGTVVLFSYDG